MTGSRALAIAERSGICDSASWPRAISSRRTTSVATIARGRAAPPTNLAALPADWVYEYFGTADCRGLSIASGSSGLSPSSASSPRRPRSEARRSGSPSRRSNRSPSLAHFAAGTLSSAAGATRRWPRGLFEHGIEVSGRERRPRPSHRGRFLRLGLAQLGEAGER